MTIRKFAFEVQSSLRTAHGIDLKRSHVHEVLAALFGFASYTALTAQRVLAQHDASRTELPFDIAGAAARMLDLGYAPPMPPIIAAVAARAAEAERLCVVTIDDVLASLGIQIGSEDPNQRADSASVEYEFEEADGERPTERHWLSIDPESEFLRESLLRMADAQSASAHLALAQLDEEFLEDGLGDIDDGSY